MNILAIIRHLPDATEPTKHAGLQTQLKKKAYTPPRLIHLEDLSIESGTIAVNAEATGGLWQTNS